MACRPSKVARRKTTNVALKRQQPTLWSCLCSAMKMCVGVCTVGARAREFSRARVCVCRAGAAERAYPRRERLARSRAAEPPDVAASAGPTAMPCTCSRKFFP